MYFVFLFSTKLINSLTSISSESSKNWSWQWDRTVLSSWDFQHWADWSLRAKFTHSESVWTKKKGHLSKNVYLLGTVTIKIVFQLKPRSCLQDEIPQRFQSILQLRKFDRLMRQGLTPLSYLSFFPT